jgi:hypothetical protein
MKKASLRGLAILALSLLLSFTMAGCWNPFAPEGGGDDPPPDDVSYRLRTTPQNVIHNLNTSYIYMNADEYLACLAEDFIFFLNPDDLTEFPDLPEYWDKNEERGIHRKMFGDEPPDDPSLVVERITFTFTHSDDVYIPGDVGDPLDDMWTYIEEIDLKVYLPPDLILHADADAEFLFRIDPDEEGPDGEPLWEIWKQWDKTEARAPHGPETGISLSRLKAMYRE